MFLRLPVMKLSTQITLKPAPISRSHKCEPIKPAPPVTTAVFFISEFYHLVMSDPLIDVPGIEDKP